MFIQLQNFIIKKYVKLLTFVGVLTINSACSFGLNQPQEPESLKRFKKIKN